mgnify:CR=1 FL=1
MLKKGIRLAALALTMALFICSWNGTFAAGEPVDGLYTVGVTSNSNMFRVVKCVLPAFRLADVKRKGLRILVCRQRGGSRRRAS